MLRVSMFGLAICASGCSLIDLGQLSDDGVGASSSGPTVGGSGGSPSSSGGSGGTTSETVTSTSGGAGGSGASGGTGGSCGGFCDAAPLGAFCDEFDDLDEWAPDPGQNVSLDTTIVSDTWSSCPSSMKLEIGSAPSPTWAQRVHYLPTVPSFFDFSANLKIESTADSVSYFEVSWTTGDWYCQIFAQRMPDGALLIAHALDVPNGYASTDLGTMFLAGAPRADDWTRFGMKVDAETLELEFFVGQTTQSMTLASHTCTTSADGALAVFLGTVYDDDPATLFYDDVIIGTN